MYKKFNEKWHAKIAWFFFFCCFRSFTKVCLNFIVRFRHLLGYSGWNELELKNKFADLTSPQETHFSFLVLSRALGRKICTDFIWNRNMCNSLWRPFPILFFLFCIPMLSSLLTFLCKSWGLSVMSGLAFVAPLN